MSFSLSESDSDADSPGHETALKSLEAIHLILPTQILPEVNVYEPETATGNIDSKGTQPKTLRGYQTLQELREKVSTFRQGYLNWRKSKPKGARGEGTDILTGRRDHRSSSTSQPLLHALELAAAVEKKASDKTLSRQSSADDVLVVGVPKTAEDEEAWLRFYFNPFTPADQKRAEILEMGTLNLLHSSPEKNLIIPEYNRDIKSITDWIMHLGVGQFHRSHQLVYMDDLLKLQFKGIKEGLFGSPTFRPCDLESKWGYCGVGLMSVDLKMADSLRPQDLLYTVLSRSNSSSSARVVGSMFDYLFAPEEADRTFKRLLDPKLRIISLTITEKGYCQNVHGRLNVDNTFIKSDIALLRCKGFPSTCPKTAIGFVYMGLRERRAAGLPPFTIMSCDNLPENGHVARRMVLEFADHLDQETRLWISQNVVFPATMVDRITPQTVFEHREILAKDFGIADRWPVVTEEYKQWIIEDNFSCGRPRWEAVGAIIVQDVRPFELMKLRLLNGGHSMLGYISYIAGHRYVDDATNDVKISSFLRSYMDEVSSTIRNVSIELERYKEKIVERFGNRMMKDLLTRICEDGSTKFYNTVKDPLIELIEEGRHIQWASLGIASWLIFLATTDPKEIKDGNKEKLVKLAKVCFENPRSFRDVKVFLRNVFGDHLGESSEFVSHVSLAFFTLNHCGVTAVLKNGGVLETIFHDHLEDFHKATKLIDFALCYTPN